MPAENGTILLPLLTLGLPARVAGWLSDAGLPSAPVETAAVRRGIGPDGGGRPVLLFDSRNASARTDAEAAAALGYKTIDAGRLLSGRPADGDSALIVAPAADPRKRFLDLLRAAVDEAGGPWVRIADFPAPYRWAVCESPIPGGPKAGDDVAAAFSAFGDLPAGPPTRRTGPSAAGRLPVADWLKTCAATGRPVLVSSDPAGAIRRGGLDPAKPPRTWTTTADEFVAWWRYRQNLGLRVCRRGRTLELELTTPDPAEAGRFPAAVEVWRGRHVAVVPVRPGALMLRDDALPFQSDPLRPPAGFTTDAADPVSRPAGAPAATCG